MDEPVIPPEDPIRMDEDPIRMIEDQPEDPNFIVQVEPGNAGKKVQMGNIDAGKTIGDVVRTCLGSKAMLKMLMDPMGGIVMTDNGNAILREITVQHPVAKTMIEIARTQDEEEGDGTTSVIVLAADGQVNYEGN